MTPVVKQLLIINVLVFILSQAMPQNYETLSLFYFESEKFRFWQPFTHMFMHASMPNLMHILFNMFALVSFGSALEHFWGGKKFLFFYISCGLGAALVQTGMNYYEIHHGIDTITNGVISSEDISQLLKTNIINGDEIYLKPMIDANPEIFNKIQDPNFDGQAFLNTVLKAYIPAVGASGAIYGLLVAFAFMFPMAELGIMFIPIPIKAKYFVPIFMFLYDGLFGIFGTSFFTISDGIGHYAHLGGALSGFILMMLWRNNKFTHTRWN
jgi:membrane associated rhomboid family serine protease